MTDRAVPLADVPAHDRRRHASPTPRRSSACSPAPAGSAASSVGRLDRVVDGRAAARGRGVPDLAGGRAGPVAEHRRGLPARPAAATLRGSTSARPPSTTVDRGRRRRLRAATCEAAGLAAGHRYAGRWSRSARCTGSSPRRATPTPIPAPTSRCPGARRACPRRSPRTRSTALLDAVVGRRPVDVARPGHPRGALRHRAAHLRAGGPVAGRPRPRRRPAAGLRQGPQGADRAARALRPRGARAPGSARAAGPRSEPAQWARRGDAEAVFLNPRGGRLTPPGGWLVVRKTGRRGGPRRPALARTCCATRAPPTCSTTAPTSGPCRSCSATPRSPRPRSTRRSPTERLRSVYDDGPPRGPPIPSRPAAVPGRLPTCGPLEADAAARRPGTSTRRPCERQLPAGCRARSAASSPSSARGDSLRSTSGSPTPARWPPSRARSARSATRVRSTTSSGPGQLDDGSYGPCEECGEPIADAPRGHAGLAVLRRTRRLDRCVESMASPVRTWIIWTSSQGWRAALR